MSTAAQVWSYLSNKLSGVDASRLLSGAPIRFLMNSGETVKWDHSVGGMVITEGEKEGGVISFGLSGIKGVVLDLEPEPAPEPSLPPIPNNPAPMSAEQEKALVDTGILEQPVAVDPIVSNPVVDPKPATAGTKSDPVVASDGPKMHLK